MTRTAKGPGLRSIICKTNPNQQPPQYSLLRVKLGNKHKGVVYLTGEKIIIMTDSQYKALRIILGENSGAVNSFEAIQSSCVKFAEWIYKNRYQRYWGSDKPNNDKWYIQYTHANRNYFTTEQLFDIFIKEYNP